MDREVGLAVCLEKSDLSRSWQAPCQSDCVDRTVPIGLGVPDRLTGAVTWFFDAIFGKSRNIPKQGTTTFSARDSFRACCRVEMHGSVVVV